MADRQEQGAGYFQGVHSRYSRSEYFQSAQARYAPQPRSAESGTSRRGFLKLLAIGGAAIAVKHYILDSDGMYVAPEAGESVLDDLPPIDTDASPLPAASKEKLDAHMPAIDKMRPVYDAIEKETGVSWKIMAAIHYREGSNNPGSSMFAGEKLGTRNPDFGDVKGTDIFSNGVKAARHFIDNAKGIYGIDVRPGMSGLELACAFLAYNRGSMYRNAKRFIGHEMSPADSPYVMNGIDEAHMNMRWPNVGNFKGPGIDWGEPESTQGKRNTPLGALTILKGLDARENGGEVVAERKIVMIADSLGVGDDRFAKIQESDAFFKKQIIYYDAAGSRPLVGVNDGVSALSRAEPRILEADSLVIALGTNMPEDEATYEAKLRELVSYYKGKNPKLTVVVPELISFKDGSKSAARRDARNGILRQLAEEGLITFVPLDIPEEDFAPDHVHLTQEGYKKRTVQILQAA